LHEAIYKHYEQFAQLGRLQIPNRIDSIIFGIDSNLNIL
jgi:hypothetical protein